MTTLRGGDKLVDAYLARLGRALRTLPASRRRQIVEEVASHIADGRALLDEESESSIRALLDRVGEPEAIAAEAGAVARPAPRSDAWVPWLILLGAFGFGVGWLIGAYLLWTSTTWPLRDKLIGTFVPPGGLGAAALLLGTSGSSTTCAGSAPVGQHAVLHCVTSGFSFPAPIGIPLLVISLVVPVLTALHLQRVRERVRPDVLVRAQADSDRD